MKKIVFILLVMIDVAKAQEGFVINGTTHPEVYPVTKVSVTYINEEGKTIKDTAQVHDGKFRIKGKVPVATGISLRFFPDTSSALVKKKIAYTFIPHIDNSEMQLEHTRPNEYTLTGSPTHDDELAFLADLRKQTKGMKIDSFVAIEKKMIDSFVRIKPASGYSLYRLYHQVMKQLKPGIYQVLFNGLPQSSKQSFYGNQIAQHLQAISTAAIGNPAPAFNLPDASGKMHTLESYKGKYLLVEFWRVQCAPCVQERKFLVQAFQNLQDQNIAFVGISVDEQKIKPQWIQMLKKKKEWLQLCDFKGYEGNVVKNYGIWGVPDNFLIDPDGIIVARNLRGENITEKIRSLMQ